MRVVKVALHRRSVRWALFLVVALILVCEATIRHLPPDGLVVSIQPSADSHIQAATLRYSGAQYQAAISQLYADFNSAALDGPLYNPLTPTCGPIGYVNTRLTFTWHGLPVQVWTSAGGCPTFRENSGGLPNLLWTRTLSDAGDQALLALA